jgi:hypothetical protein
MMNDNTLFIGLIVLIFAMLLAIIIYMIAPEQYMPEVCREHIDASTKICNGGFK